MELHTGKYGATRQSWSRDAIRVVFQEIKRSNSKASHKILVQLLAERMREDDDALKAAADYIVTACEVAQIGYAERERKTTTPEQRAEVAEQIANTAEAIKNQILVLNLEMPNGKRLRNCTGREMAQFGSAYQRIAKRVGPTKTVGTVLDEAGVRKLMA
jgi:hypothetical protein